mmetsp:Transcript_4140/g.10370  ORF Transcript_4140/g.10370 Transcript_4140/m.10370 type:complete len:210 (-) Transcript_4140:1291-1920(-)
MALRGHVGRKESVRVSRMRTAGREAARLLQGAQLLVVHAPPQVVVLALLAPATLATPDLDNGPRAARVAIAWLRKLAHHALVSRLEGEHHRLLAVRRPGGARLRLVRRSPFEISKSISKVHSEVVRPLHLFLVVPHVPLVFEGFVLPLLEHLAALVLSLLALDRVDHLRGVRLQRDLSRPAVPALLELLEPQLHRATPCRGLAVWPDDG